MARKVLYFIAGDAPTAAETLQIANIVGDVQIRSAKFNATFGGRLEPANALAGSIPAAYLTASGGTAVDTDVFPGGDVTPKQGGYGLTIIPVITASYDPDGGSGEAAVTASTIETFV